MPIPRLSSRAPPKPLAHIIEFWYIISSKRRNQKGISFYTLSLKHNLTSKSQKWMVLQRLIIQRTTRPEMESVVPQILKQYVYSGWFRFRWWRGWPYELQRHLLQRWSQFKIHLSRYRGSFPIPWHVSTIVASSQMAKSNGKANP